MPNMPTFWYMLRRCGTLKICGKSRSRTDARRCRRSPGRSTPYAALPVRVERVAAVAGARVRSVTPAGRLKKQVASRPPASGGAASCRGCGSGSAGTSTCRMKSVNACMSAVRQRLACARAARRTRVERLERRVLVEGAVSGWALGASSPPVRSPRQCIGPWLAMPRRLCVVIGPFIGWKSVEAARERRQRA